MQITRSLDIVIPVYNEGDCIRNFFNSLVERLNELSIGYHIIFVNDGSSDDTQKKLEEIAKNNSTVRIVELSRNFGHQAAITCGMAESQADYVITMDGDGEHPVEKISEMIALADNGFDIVLTQRKEGQSAPWFKRVTSDVFYKILCLITSTPILDGVGDFRLMKRVVVDSLNKMPEYHRFLRGMVSFAGFHFTVLPYIPAQRMGGQSKYTLKKMLTLAKNGIFSFSLAPIIASLFFGLVLLSLSIILGIISLINPFFGSPANSLFIFLILFCTGAIITSSSLIGYYSGMTFQQVKSRPIYLVRSRTNFP